MSHKIDAVVDMLYRAQQMLIELDVDDRVAVGQKLVNALTNVKSLQRHSFEHEDQCQECKIVAGPLHLTIKASYVPGHKSEAWGDGIPF